MTVFFLVSLFVATKQVVPSKEVTNLIYGD